MTANYEHHSQFFLPALKGRSLITGVTFTISTLVQDGIIPAPLK